MRRNSLIHLTLTIVVGLANLPKAPAQNWLSLAGDWQVRINSNA